jgi:L-lysine 2,3-aminomutase
MENDDPDWGLVDASNEYSYQVVPGIQHKYADSALFLTTDRCFGRCRYCFRKRLFLSSGKYELPDKYDVPINYIKEHSEIDNVILSGGDPLALSTKTLKHIISKLRQIEHLKIIRRLYFMLHFSHPNEITDEAGEAVRVLLQAGAILYNQTPLVRGINDDSKIIANLCNKLSYIGVTPYYFFQMRPTVGNKPFAIPLTEAYQIFGESQKNLSGVAKTARLIMSHKSGKIEVIGLDESTIYFKQHRSPRSEECSQLMIADRNDQGYWLEDFHVKYLSADAYLAYPPKK